MLQEGISYRALVYTIVAANRADQKSVGKRAGSEDHKQAGSLLAQAT
jgi:hypothetical protein